MLIALSSLLLWALANLFVTAFVMRRCDRPTSILSLTAVTWLLPLLGPVVAAALAARRPREEAGRSTVEA